MPPQKTQYVPATIDLPSLSISLPNPNASPLAGPNSRAEKSNGWYHGVRYSSDDLWTAALNSDTNGLRKCLRAGLNVNYCGSISRPMDMGIGVRSIADIIAYRKNVEAMRLLLEYQVDLSGALTAARWQKIRAFDSLKGKDRSLGSLWTTPLHEACKRGHRDLLEVLLAEGRADPNVADGEKRTTLLIAAKEGDIEMAKLLCKHGAMLDSTNTGGQSPLLAAVSHGQPDMVRLLVEHGAKLETLHAAGENAFLNATRGSNRAVMPVLLACGANIDSRSRQCESAFLMAASKSDVDAMEVLVHHGANVDIGDVDGCTALHRAVMATNPPLVKHLLRLGADIDAQDDDLWTPLFVAMIQNNHDVVTTLLTSGADLGESRARGGTALHQAAMLGSTAVVRYLLTGPSSAQIDLSGMNLAGETPLMLASKYGHSPVVKLLLKHGAKSDPADPDGHTALDHAVYWGHYACVVHLLEGGFNPHDRVPLLFYYGKQRDHSRTSDYNMISTLLQNRGVPCIQWPEKPMSLKFITPTRDASMNSLRARLQEKRGKPVTTAKDAGKFSREPFERPFSQTADRIEAGDVHGRNNAEIVMQAADIAVNTTNAITTILGS